MKITGIKIKKIYGETKLKAVCRITFDDCFVVHDVRILEGDRGFFVAMPSKTMPDGKFVDVAHPIKAEMRIYIEEEIKKALKLMEGIQ